MSWPLIPLLPLDASCLHLVLRLVVNCCATSHSTTASRPLAPSPLAAPLPLLFSHCVAALPHAASCPPAHPLLHQSPQPTHCNSVPVVGLDIV
jgi:hypothetical protein